MRFNEILSEKTPLGNADAGIFAVALSNVNPGSKIYILSDKNGEPWGDFFPNNITHVFVDKNGHTMDAKGMRSVDDMAKDFSLAPGSYKIFGGFEAKDFFNKFVGVDDTKPFTGTTSDLKKALEFIVDNKEKYTL